VWRRLTHTPEQGESNFALFPFQEIEKMASKKTKQFVDLSFMAHGYIKQTVKITKDGITPRQLVDMLNSGEAATTIYEHNGSVEIFATGEKIGEVVNMETELEYDDFEFSNEPFTDDDGWPEDDGGSDD
jgi:hypothetical protein